MKKRNFIFASHGTLAQGVYNALVVITGGNENVTVYSAYLNGQQTNVAAEAEQLIAGYPADEEVIVLTDLYGGSVNTEFVRLTEKYDIHVVSGLSLPLALFVLDSEEEETGEMLRKAVEQAKSSVQYCNQVLQQEQAEDEF